MSFENPASIIKSFNIQGSFSNASITQDRLVPGKWERVRQPFTRTFRESNLPTNVDWGVTHSYFLPESLRVVGSIFVEITLPALGNGNYKECPGLYAIQEQRFMSAGTESYKVNPALMLREYVSSLSNEEADQFCRTYLGKKDAVDGSARVILVPLFLPNSHYFHRDQKVKKSYGAFPAYLGQNRLECQLSFAAAASMVQSGADAPATVANAIKVLVHQVEMQPTAVNRYSDARGAYSVINKRFTELTTGWTNYASAGSLEKLTQIQPIGTCVQLLVQAVPAGTADANKEILTCVPASFIEVVADSITQRSLGSAHKVAMELYSNGFVHNNVANNCSRISFSAHGSDDGIWSGGFAMQLNSQINLHLKFDQAVDYRVYAVQYQRITINSIGLVQSTLE